MNVQAMTLEHYEALATAHPTLVIIGRPSCSDCTQWHEVLRDWNPPSEPIFSAFSLNLDDAVGQHFCEEHPWTSSIQHIPFNVLFRDGVPVEQWTGGSLQRMEEKIANVV